MRVRGVIFPSGKLVKRCGSPKISSILGYTFLRDATFLFRD